MLLKVDMSELTKQLFRFFVVSARRFFSRVKIPKINPSYPSPPLTKDFIKINTFISASVIVPSLILCILTRRANAKIFVLIIKRLVIDVVNWHPIRSASNKAVHKNSLLFTSRNTYITHGVERFHFWIVSCIPQVLIQLIETMVGHLRYLPLCQFDFFHAVLQNKIPAESWVKHETTGRWILTQIRLLDPDVIR